MPQFVCPFISWWTFELFPVFGDYEQKLLWTFSSECLCEHRFSFFLDKNLGVRCQLYAKRVLDFIRNCQTVFQSSRPIAHAHQQRTEVPVDLCPRQRLPLSGVFSISHSNWCVVVFRGGFHWNFCHDLWCWGSFHVYIGHQPLLFFFFFFAKRLFRCFAPFFFLLANCLFSFWVMRVCKYFLQVYIMTF